jgi:hypothetical protein
MLTKEEALEKFLAQTENEEEEVLTKLETNEEVLK